MKITKENYKKITAKTLIRFKEDNEAWSEAFLLYNTNHKDDELSMRHRFSYYPVRRWIMEQVKNKKINLI